MTILKSLDVKIFWPYMQFFFPAASNITPLTGKVKVRVKVKWPVVIGPDITHNSLIHLVFYLFRKANDF